MKRNVNTPNKRKIEIIDDRDKKVVIASSNKEEHINSDLTEQYKLDLYINDHGTARIFCERDLKIEKVDVVKSGYIDLQISPAIEKDIKTQKKLVIEKLQLHPTHEINISNLVIDGMLEEEMPVVINNLTMGDNTSITCKNVGLPKFQNINIGKKCHMHISFQSHEENANGMHAIYNFNTYDMLGPGVDAYASPDNHKFENLVVCAKDKNILPILWKNKELNKALDCKTPGQIRDFSEKYLPYIFKNSNLFEKLGIFNQELGKTYTVLNSIAKKDYFYHTGVCKKFNDKQSANKANILAKLPSLIINKIFSYLKFSDVKSTDFEMEEGVLKKWGDLDKLSIQDSKLRINEECGDIFTLKVASSPAIQISEIYPCAAKPYTFRFVEICKNSLLQINSEVGEKNNDIDNLITINNLVLNQSAQLNCHLNQFKVYNIEFKGDKQSILLNGHNIVGHQLNILKAALKITALKSGKMLSLPISVFKMFKATKEEVDEQSKAAFVKLGVDEEIYNKEFDLDVFIASDNNSEDLTEISGEGNNNDTKYTL